MLLVRAGELACRNDWGGDLFQSRDEAPETDDTSFDIPGQSDIPDARDDEVTSIITRPQRPSGTTSPEDRVVSDRPVPSRRDDDDDPWNDAAHREQEERARIIARGSRDALMHARKRHSSRLSRSQADADTAESSADDGPVVTPRPRFTGRNRSRFSAPSYSTDPVPKAEIESRQSSVQERFDSVPPIDPNFDLPGVHGELDEPPADPHQEQPTTSHGEDVGRPLSSYEYALNRARRTRQERQHKNRAVRHAHPNHTVADELPSQSTEESTSAVRLVMGPEPGADTEQSAAQLPAIDIVSDAETIEDPPTEPVATEAVSDEPFDELESEDTYYDAPEVHEDPQELHGRHEDDAFDNDYDYDDWHEDNVPTLQAERSHDGWFSRFIPRRRHPQSWHDESMITRHTEVDAEQESRLYVPAGYDTPVDDELPLTAEAERGSAIEPTRHWSDDQREMQRLHKSATEDVVARDNARSQHVFIDESDVAPIPGPVPATRPRQEPMHRPRVVQELPDLDDNLFAGHFDRVRQEQRAADAVDRVPATTLE
ncbi:MAG: hypothetical protein M3173_05835, partial [Chloroflexota bacterium]|nr:hypothetical protein [Chloroflexota bacterium]